MGQTQLANSEQNDQSSAEFHKKKIFAVNGRQCLEKVGAGTHLNLGCGKIKWDRWTNIDFQDSDLNCDIKQLPLNDNFADTIIAVHVLEHFYAWEAPVALNEWKRVLKSGGKLILELPSMDKVLNYITYCMNNNIEISASMGWFAFWGDPKYRNEHMVHKWGYTKQSLRELLEQLGFKNIEFEKPNYHFEMRDMRVVAYK